MSRSRSSRTSVCTTIVVLPTCTGSARTWNVPLRTARKKLVFDSIVVVPIDPGGKL
ncbi:MAG TPA: hypothetical protein VFS00_20405 [Polyangiaceae bacterium]|nr:hypothetical protein [Polyangiaceae bacterium]